MNCLHLVGAEADDGGILSVLRALSAATVAVCRHVVWVNSVFKETRFPPLDLRRSPHALDESPGHLRLLIRNLRAWPGLRALLRSEPFSVVHAHTRGALPLAMLLARERPVVFTNHAYARRQGLYRFAARRPGIYTALLTPSMARHYQIKPSPGRVEIISECCHDDWFARPSVPAVPRGPNAPLGLVGVGNLVAWKKWDLVLRALALIPEEDRRRVTFTLWGPTPTDDSARRFAAELDSLATQLGLRGTIRLAGPTNEVPRALAQADAFVLPSTNEPCSVALIEALASGLPVLASRSGGNVDIVRHGATGLLFAPDDIADLGSQIQRFLHGAFKPAAPEEIRDSVRSRSASAVSTEYLRVYRGMIAT